MKDLKIDFDDIQDCVDRSFDTENHASSDNNILKREAKIWKNSGPAFFPALIINDVTYRGFLNNENAFEAICEGFKKHPKECRGLGGGSDSHIFNGISTQT